MQSKCVKYAIITQTYYLNILIPTNMYDTDVEYVKSLYSV